MVCLGNICRSPLAEGIMRQLSQNQKLDWTIASAGTGSWHIGNAPDKRSIAAARDLGYDISKQRAQQFNNSFFDKYDLIFAMDRNNYREILSQAKSQEEGAKVQLFLEDDEVIDPYYDNALFNPVCTQIENRCKEIIKKLTR